MPLSPKNEHYLCGKRGNFTQIAQPEIVIAAIND
jgi:hypothetical protein